MTSSVLMDALKIVADGGRVPDQPDLFAAAMHMVNRLVTDVARLRGVSEATVRVSVGLETATRTTERGPGGPIAPSVDGATEPGGHGAMWDGTGSWF